MSEPSSTHPSEVGVCRVQETPSREPVDPMLWVVLALCAAGLAGIAVRYYG
jgi:hypothetical protein